jgi:hypothetical protein
MNPENKILEEIIPPGLCAYAKAKYVKVYKAPNRDAQVFDMMHFKGLRINVDIEHGKPNSELFCHIVNFARRYRPDSYHEIESDIKFVAKFASNSLSKNNLLVPYDIGSGKFITRWSQLMFEDFLRKIRINLSYEQAIELLNKHYEIVD